MGAMHIIYKKIKTFSNITGLVFVVYIHSPKIKSIQFFSTINELFLYLNIWDNWL